jgi:hypothetical protein
MPGILCMGWDNFFTWRNITGMRFCEALALIPDALPWYTITVFRQDTPDPFFGAIFWGVPLPSLDRKLWLP